MASLGEQNARDLALKMKLEIQLDKSMRKFFKTIAKDMRTHFKATRQVIDPRKYDLELGAILRGHYRKTAKAFEDRLRTNLIKTVGLRLRETKALDDKIKSAVNDHLYKRSNEQTSIISQTNAEEFDNAFQEARSDAFANNSSLSDDEVADEASDIFERRGLGRSKTIGQTETQYAAEATKSIEAYILLSEEDVIADGVVLKPENVTKTWSAILDNHTREAHIEADDQTVDEEEPFIVDGEKLMFPGDTSMGASLENVINCRCNTVRAIELTELPEFVNQPANRAPQRGNVFFP